MQHCSEMPHPRQAMWWQTQDSAAFTTEHGSQEVLVEIGERLSAKEEAMIDQGTVNMQELEFRH